MKNFYTVNLYNKLADIKPRFSEQFETFQKASDYMEKLIKKYAKADIVHTENGKDRISVTTKGQNL